MSMRIPQNPRLDVLRLAAEGLSGAQIAKELSTPKLPVTEDIVKRHLLGWRHKLGALNTVHAVVIAYSRGLLGPVDAPCGRCGHVRAVLMGHLPQRRRTLPTSDFALLFDEIRGIYRTREDA